MATIKKPSLNAKSVVDKAKSVANTITKNAQGQGAGVNGSNRTYNANGDYTDKDSSGRTVGWGRAGTEHLSRENSGGGGGGSSYPSGGNIGRVNFDDYRTNLLTVEDIASKYGFDYSRDYAKSQAELIKRQQQEGLEETRNRVNNDLYSSIENLDRNYFQQYQQMMNNQAVNGVNGALAADQALRANMGRQASASDLYRDNNAANYEIQNALGRLAAEATMYEDQLYNERLQQAFQNILSEGQFRQSDNLAAYQGALQQRGQDIGIDQFNRNLSFQQDQANVAQNQWMQEFQRMLNRDQVGDQQWQSTFDWGKLMDEAGLTGQYNGQRTLAGQQFDWGKLMDEAGLTGYYNGDRTMAGQSFDWNKIVDEAGLTGMYNGDPTFDRYRWQTEFDWQKYMDQQNLALARSRAFRPSGGSGRSSSGGSSSASLPGNLSQQYQQFKQAQAQGAKTPADRYYEAMEPIFKGSVVRQQPVIQPPSIASNPNLSQYDRFKMMQSQYGF